MFTLMYSNHSLMLEWILSPHQSNRHVEFYAAQGLLDAIEVHIHCPHGCWHQSTLHLAPTIPHHDQRNTSLEVMVAKRTVAKGHSFWGWQYHFLGIGLISSMLFGEKVRISNAAGLLEIHSEGFLTHWKDVDSQNVQWKSMEYHRIHTYKLPIFSTTKPTKSTFGMATHAGHRTDLWFSFFYDLQAQKSANISLSTILFQLHFAYLNPRCDATDKMHEP